MFEQAGKTHSTPAARRGKTDFSFAKSGKKTHAHTHPRPHPRRQTWGCNKKPGPAQPSQAARRSSTSRAEGAVGSGTASAQTDLAGRLGFWVSARAPTPVGGRSRPRALAHRQPQRPPRQQGRGQPQQEGPGWWLRIAWGMGRKKFGYAREKNPLGRGPRKNANSVRVAAAPVDFECTELLAARSSAAAERAGGLR